MSPFRVCFHCLRRMFSKGHRWCWVKVGLRKGHFCECGFGVEWLPRTRGNNLRGVAAYMVRLFRAVPSSPAPEEK